MQPLVILNPKSHGGQTGRRISSLRATIQAALGQVELAQTERPRHAVDIAEQAAREGRPSVLAVGGDGTVHEVVNGLMRARSEGAAGTRLGIIGHGTGGDLRRTLGLEHRLEAYLSAIAGGATRAIDVGAFRYQTHDDRPAEAFFVNILSMGMGGLVDQYVATLGRALPGVAAYFTATLGALVQSRVGQLRCTVEQGTSSRVVHLASRNLAICNGRFFGSGMEVAPMAVPDDGLFHVVSLPARSRVGFAMSSLSIYSGRHIEQPDVEVLTCDRIAVELDNPSVRDKFLLDVDGEPLGKLPLEVELVPRAIEIFAPTG